ncbi:hypothetical protein ACFL35_09850 [Candidatus Riflebacteria bacterium]
MRYLFWFIVFFGLLPFSVNSLIAKDRIEFILWGFGLVCVIPGLRFCFKKEFFRALYLLIAGIFLMHLGFDYKALRQLREEISSYERDEKSVGIIEVSIILHNYNNLIWIIENQVNKHRPEIKNFKRIISNLYFSNAHENTVKWFIQYYNFVKKKKLKIDQKLVSYFWDSYTQIKRKNFAGADVVKNEIIQQQKQKKTVPAKGKDNK